MNSKMITPVVIGSTFIWIGFVVAISFMEAWLKFQAPGITLSLGLGIGRLVFGALNTVEWILAIAIIVSIVFTKQRGVYHSDFFFLVPVIIVLVQTVWLLPALDLRAQLVIDGKLLPPSNLHLYYIILELIKVVCLTFFGFSLFKQLTI